MVDKKLLDSIEGVYIENVEIRPDDRGFVRRFVRSDDDGFTKFGEVYFSFVYKDKVKAWHGYPKKKMFYSVLSGAVRLVLYDVRLESPTYQWLQIINLSAEMPQRVSIPNGVFNGFKGLESSLIAICASEPFHEETIVRLPPDSPTVPYEWGQ